MGRLHSSSIAVDQACVSPITRNGKGCNARQLCVGNLNVLVMDKHTALFLFSNEASP